MIKHLKRVSTIIFGCLGIYYGAKHNNHDMYDAINMMVGVVTLYITIIATELCSGENW